MLSLALFRVTDASLCRNFLTRLKRYLLTRLYVPYRAVLACTVLPPLGRFLRDESRPGAAQPFVCRNLFVVRFGSLADMCSAKGMSALPPKADIPSAERSVR